MVRLAVRARAAPAYSVSGTPARDRDVVEALGIARRQGRRSTPDAVSSRRFGISLAEHGMQRITQLAKILRRQTAHLPDDPPLLGSRDHGFEHRRLELVRSLPVQQNGLT